METYTYTGYARELYVGKDLGREGILSGKYGDLRFRRCEDGLSIMEGNFPGSGFIVYPVSADLFLPDTVNGIPVTEIRSSVSITRELPIAIEGSNIRRAYLQIEFPPAAEEDITVSVEAFNQEGMLDHCEIECRNDIHIGNIFARHLKVKAEKVILKDHACSGLESAEFTGKVYPFIYPGWEGEEPNTDFFSGTVSLKTVDGSLSGDECWIFKDCTALDKVHLSNGITRVPPRAFENCASLTDLYIPDTVTEIGEYAFSGCMNLKTIHLPSGIKTISKGMFMNCCSLTKCFLSDDIEYIEDEAFKGCSSLRKPWIPRNIKKISETAFDDPEWAKI